MQVKALVLKHSFLHKDWRGRARIGGTFQGVKFHITAGGYYVCNDVPQDKLPLLQQSNYIQIELTTGHITIEHPPLEKEEKSPSPVEDAVEEIVVEATPAKPLSLPSPAPAIPEKRSPGRPKSK